MAVGLGLCFGLLFSFAIICSAQNTISFSGEEMAVVVLEAAKEGRSLKVKLDDYGEASANHEHNPRTDGGGGGGESNGGSRSRHNS